MTPELESGRAAQGDAGYSVTTDDLPGEIGPYTIVGPLGVGGMGQIVRARDRRLGRDVAIKLLSDRNLHDPGAIERFSREARAASALNHPNIVTLYDTGEIGGRHYIVMELVKGKTLRSLIDNERSALDLVPRVAEQIALALAAAHDAGIVHRDIKPENIMVRDDGYVKVLDFGIARLTSTLTEAAISHTEVTRTGLLVGTPRYMSPEQVGAEPVSGASDIFSLGVVLYEWTTGQHPFVAGSTVQLLVAIGNDEPLAPARVNPLVPAYIDALIVEMMHKDPARRPSAAEVAERLAKPGAVPMSPRVLARTREEQVTVGRPRERAILLEMLGAAARGHGRMVGVAGEAGMGKTTLVEDVLRDLTMEADERPWFIGRGRCSERLAGTEAYLPFLDALGNLLRSDGHETCARLMKSLAPTWYQQLNIVTPITGTFEEVRARSQERLKRELLGFVSELSALRPLVFLFEDMHWADASTVDLLTYITTNFERLPLAIVATYRSSELRAANHPLVALTRELEAHGRARELGLDFLTMEDVLEYVTLTFGSAPFCASLARFVHGKTEGNPLFMADLARDLRDRGVVARDGEHGASWQLTRELREVEREVPASIRSMVQRKIDALSESDRRLLVVASVQGAQFDTAIVATALEADAAAIEERLDVLERVHAFVRLVGEEALPDGTPSSQYRFVHVLYQNGLYDSLRAVRRASLSGAMARALLATHRREPTAIASELALLFEAAGDRTNAAQHFLVAARRAADIFADAEAIKLATRAVDALRRAPTTPQRAQLELQAQLAIGRCLTRLRGYAAPEVAQAYTRALALCEQLENPAATFPVLQGLWRFYCVKGDLAKGDELARQLLEMATKTADQELAAMAHLSFSTPAVHLGRFAEASAHMEQALALCDVAQSARIAAVMTGSDLQASALAWWALALWLSGYSDQANDKHSRAVARLPELKDPFARAYALALGGWFDQYRREPEAVLDTSSELLELSLKREFGIWIPTALCLRGWALAELGQPAEGVAEIRRGLAAFASIGVQLNVPHFTSMLVEALIRMGQWREASCAAEDGLSLVAVNHDRCWESELRRLNGTALLALGSTSEAEQWFRDAIVSASGLSACILELRATVDLARLWHSQRRYLDAQDALRSCLQRVTEGSESRDLVAARRLMSELTATPTDAGAPFGTH
jgi:tetratricopeptide (TPR) repeat protein